jgi:hypothetical protein
MRRTAALLLALLLAVLAASCGSSQNGADGGSASLGDDAGGSGSGSGGFGFGNSGEGGTQSTLVISPPSATLTVVSGQAAPTQQFAATNSGQPVMPAWSLTQGALGTIDTNGLFTASGTAGGQANVVATYGSQMATASIAVNLQATQQGDPAASSPVDAGAGGYGGVGGDGPGPAPSTAQVGVLNGARTSDSKVQILYPYTGTVWPQGILAPLLQWDPGGHSFDSVYVELSEKYFTYKGYFAANATPFLNLPIPEQVWTTLAYSNAGEPVNLSIVFGEGSHAYGPYQETWTVAQATLQGTIYYNSYGTALVQNSDTTDSYGEQYGAGTLAIAPGATSPTLVAGVSSPPSTPPGGANQPANGSGCRVCHTVSANGQSLVTQASNASADDYSVSVAIHLANDTTGGAGTQVGTNLTFPALYKDGSLVLSSAGGFGYTQSTSALYSLPSGNTVSGVTGLGTPSSPLQATLPAFSPDGKHLSFNFWAGTLASGTTMLTGDQVSLAILDFDGVNTFSNPRVLYTPASGYAVTYSSFLPDSSGIVFEIELSNPSGSWGYTWQGDTAELWWVDVASGKAQRLQSLNGYSAGGSPYLPSGGSHAAAEDVTLNYEPTVNPIASGGYAWVVFTSRRMYGNVAQLDPWTSDPREYPWKTQVTDKKLWVAAIDLDAKPGTDPSHPAFYLPAQELHAGNARGYWTVEPCRASGQSCQAGDQCCGGYCEQGDGGGLVCTSNAPVCSGTYDKCTTSSDCCGAAQGGVQCVGGVCTVSLAQ